MPKELKNITESVMGKIRKGEIKMRPRSYFVAGSVLTFIGLVASVLVSVFLVGLMRFSLRAHGPMGEYRLEQLIGNFPWWAPVVAVLGLVFGIRLLRLYDFSYKANYKVVVVGFVVAVVVAGWFIDTVGLNDVLARRGPMRGMMRQYLQENNIQSRVGDGIYLGFIHGVDVGKREIQFDDAVWLSGTKGEDAAIKAGHCTEETRTDCLPNDYFISNSLVKNLVLQLNPDAIIFMKTWEAEKFGILDREIGFADFSKLISDKENRWDNVPYNITIQDGKVIRIEEVYIP
jgi:hypothetical protein